MMCKLHILLHGRVLVSMVLYHNISILVNGEILPVNHQYVCYNP
jgi:hypothetical protein